MAELEERFEDVYDELREELEELCHEKRYNDLRKRFLDLNPVDIAWLFDDMPEDHLPVMFRLLSKEVAADVFINLESDSQEMLIKGFSNAELEAILDEMFLDDTVDFLEEVPASVVTRVLAHSDPETRKLINRFLKYPEDCAGSLMTIEMVHLQTTLTAAQAIEKIRKTGVDKETVYTCYCIDREHHLLGSVPLLSLLLCDENALVGDVMEDDAQLISVNTLDDREYVVEVVKKYDLLSVPVVDNENRLVGIISHVGALKEKIDKMIVVKKEKNGSSSLKIIV